MKLYVGNLSYNTTEDTLRERFSNYGDVVSVQIMKDRFTQQSKGFAFVEMATDIMGERGIGGMNGKEVDGRRIRVTVAVEKSERSAGGKRFSDKKDFRRDDRTSFRPRREHSNRDNSRKSNFHKEKSDFNGENFPKKERPVDEY